MARPTRGGRGRGALRWTRRALTGATAALLVLCLWGIAAPAAVRCPAPGAVGCPGGWLGPAAGLQPGDLTQWFDVTMHDYGFWIVNTASGVNESSQWTILEGYTVHVNATSLNPVASLGGTSAHGLGVLGDGINFQLYTTIGGWSNTSFPAPTQPATGLEVYCVNNCGSGHSGMHEYILDVVPPEAPPVPSVQTGPTDGPYPLQVNFTASAQNGTLPYRFDWNFGDGTTGVGASVSHFYLEAGHFRATLTVFDANGVAGTASVPITVTVPPGLNVTASVDPSSGPAPLTVAFSSTVGNGTGPFSYTWFFGDGTIASVPDPGHVFRVPGDYTVDLAVQDSTGKNGAAYLRVNVSGAPSPLRLVISLHPASADLPTANVSGYASEIGGSPPYGPVTWSWGDGSPSSTGDPGSHVYQGRALGSYVVEASVKDSLGVTATARANYSWYPAAGGTVAALLSSEHVPSSAELILNATGGNGSFGAVLWDFGDGTTATESTVAFHNYTTAGSFRVAATCHDSTGALIVAVTWVNLTAAAGGSGGGGVLRVTVSPLVPLAAFSALGLGLLLLAARQERATLPPRGEEAPPETGPPDAATSEGVAAPGRAEELGRVATRARRWALPATAACLVGYWLWSPNGPSPGSGELWSVIGGALGIVLVSSLLVGVAVPVGRRVRRELARSLTLPLGTLVAFGVWLLASREIVVTGGALPPSGPGIAVALLHSPFGTWPALEVGGPGPFRLELVPPLWILFGTLSYLAVATAHLAAARAGARRTRAPPGARPSLGAIAACVPALGLSNGCCSPPAWSFVLSGIGLLAAADPLYAQAPDLVDGALCLASIAVTLALLTWSRPRAPSPPREPTG
jgi:PKD repeat protein